MEVNSIILESKSRFGFNETLEKIRELAAMREWKILAEHDMQKTLKNNGIEVQEAVVIELCKPEYAGALMQEDPVKFVSALLPCRFGVYCKADGNSYLSRLNTGMLSMFMAGTIGSVMGKAGSEMELIIKELIEADPLPDF